MNKKGDAAMAVLNIFVSFEYDKDKELVNHFIKQAQKHSQYRVKNKSLKESYPDDGWRRRASDAIRECDVVVVLVGEDTHNAQGIIVETDMARSLDKPVIQVASKGRRDYRGLTRLDEPIPWKWATINHELDQIANRLNR